MDRRLFIKTSGLVTASVGLFSAKSAAESSPQGTQAQPASPVNPFEQEGKWYKGAFHVHTTTSDGDVDVATRIAHYRELGYDVVAVTDHWKTNDLSSFSDDKFLAISGMEAHPKTGTGAPAHHFVCLDLPHPFELDKNLPAQELIDKVLNIGGKVIYAHPYWTAHTIEEMSEVQGYIGVEVFNGVCQARWGKGFGNVHWDQVCNKGRIIAGMATDDVHKVEEINMGWTMVKAKGLNKADIMDAIARGSYYASCGPTIEDFRFQDGAVHIQSSPVSEIRFRHAGAGGGRRFRAEEGKTMTHAELKFKVGWVRAEVLDQQGNYAWTSPIVINA